MSTDDKVYPQNCPICGVSTNYIYSVKGLKSETSTWFKCNCGVIFQKDKPSGAIYDGKYLKEYQAKGIVRRLPVPCRVYAPLIEQLMYGRTVLDVGYASKVNMKEWEKRGWLTYGIEINKAICELGNIYKGDFLDYDFNIKLPPEIVKENTGEETIPDRTFDLIWMSDVLEHFIDPLKALGRVYKLLSDTGVLYISTPDIDFISKTGVPSFPYWRKDEHYVMWSERALKRELERLGFRIIMCRRNFSGSFHSFYNLHLICQKAYY